MKTELQEKYIMKRKTQRDVLSWRAFLNRVAKCAPPNYHEHLCSSDQNVRMSLCALRGGLTIEASFVLPFFLMILLAFFSFFSQYASAAELQILAAAEAKKAGIALGNMQKMDAGDITIYKTEKIKNDWQNPFIHKNYMIQSATCRAWIGFTGLESCETYVYITPEGSVYHLYADCTHLKLSIQRVSIAKARSMKNEYGGKYSACELCGDSVKTLVYLTSEGNRYHSNRSCSGLKRTIRQVPMSEVSGRSGCIRCNNLSES